MTSCQSTKAERYLARSLSPMTTGTTVMMTGLLLSFVTTGDDRISCSATAVLFYGCR